MAKPEPVIKTNKRAGENEERIGELDDWEAAQIARIHQVGEDTQEGEPKWQSIKEPEQHLNAYNAIDQSGEQATCDHCVFFYQF